MIRMNAYEQRIWRGSMHVSRVIGYDQDERIRPGWHDMVRAGKTWFLCQPPLGQSQGQGASCFDWQQPLHPMLLHRHSRPHLDSSIFSLLVQCTGHSASFSKVCESLCPQVVVDHCLEPKPRLWLWAQCGRRAAHSESRDHAGDCRRVRWA